MESWGLVFIGGEAPERRVIEPLLEQNPRLVAADSGLDTMLKMKLTPHILVGDLDSVSPEALAAYPDLRIKHFPVDKDYTDTELALVEARNLGVRRIVLIGGGGGRLDHLLGIRSLFDRLDGPDRWYTARDEVVRIKNSFYADCKAGRTIGFFPLAEPTRSRTTGLRWNLDGLVWGHGCAGVSNQTEGAFMVTLEEGALLMVRALADNDCASPLDAGF